MQEVPRTEPGVLFEPSTRGSVVELLGKIKDCELQYTFEAFPARHSDELVALHEELESQILQGKSTYAQALYKLWLKGGYIQVCPVPAAGGNDVSLRLANYRTQNEWRFGIGGAQDVFSTALALAGMKGTQTHLHVDEGSACNEACAVLKVCCCLQVCFITNITSCLDTWHRRT